MKRASARNAGQIDQQTFPTYKPVMSYQITWKHIDADLNPGITIEQKVELFRHRVWGWQLHIADLVINGGEHHDGKSAIKNIPHAGFAALQILMSYFETIARHENGDVGRENNKVWFKKGVLSVFPDIATKLNGPDKEAFTNKLYYQVRCGLYHMSIPGSDVAISRMDSAIKYERTLSRVLIDPHNLALDLKAHFRRYIASLGNPAETQLRTAFEKRFNSDYGIKPLKKY